MKSMWMIVAAVVMAGSPVAPAQETAASRPTLQMAARPSPGVTLEQVVHDIDYRRTEPERLMVVLRFTPEPELPLANVQRVVAAQKANDDQGHSLVLAGGAFPADLHPGTTSMVGIVSGLVTVVLKPPPAEGERVKKLVSLEGVIPAMLAEKTETVELAAPGKEVREFAGGVKGTFTATMTNATTCRVEYMFDLPEELTNQERQGWSSQFPGLRVKVVDAAGVVWRQGGESQTTSGENKHGLKASFSPPPGKAVAGPPKVSLEIVTGFKAKDIPFRVENIPLP